jgi:hypothetical protein
MVGRLALQVAADRLTAAPRFSCLADGPQSWRAKPAASPRAGGTTGEKSVRGTVISPWKTPHFTVFSPQKHRKTRKMCFTVDLLQSKDLLKISPCFAAR